ncbi:hypothetical protein Rhopal_000057-T1 [Rhodotorula paludigena]|uniref:WLM domain-containing protein n=1 Tax=Rhodotorula paludigena TaxID=86838 RepID=A0AAV5GDD0_9BASI|nr:hypothetical protein Rhopal_000057-T1 [Rhodotorula paludigena]
MPVGHERINARRPDPNDNITFIRALEGAPDSDRALEILEALAAQFKPIMKTWGFGVNSLVEHEWNPTFAGRNWNAGEVIEIVLRRPNGEFAPYQFLLYVMAHELAHIREMNHSWAFKKVNEQIRREVTNLRAKGYYGDGFWSSGRSLKYPNATAPLTEADEPTFTCGGANKKRRFRRRRRAPTPVGPTKARGSAVKLGNTGRQTAIAAKAGGRVTRKGAFPKEGGQTLGDDPEQSTYRRRAQSKDAVSARAVAAEARLARERALRAAEARASGAPAPASPDKKPALVDLTSDGDSEGEGEVEGGGAFEGWETDEEDKPERVLRDEEKRWLEEDMRGWRAAFGDEDEERDVKPAVAEGSGQARWKGKGKKRAATSEEVEDVKPDIGSSKRTAASPSPSTSSRHQNSTSSSAATKRRLSPSPAVDPFAGLDLTPEERAWLAADASEHSAGGDVEHVGKKARVAMMSMPGWMGGKGASGGGKRSGAGGKGETNRTAWIDWFDDDAVLADSEEDEEADALASKPAKAIKKAGPSSRKHRLSTDDDEPRAKPSTQKSAASGSKLSTSAALSPSRRAPMKFFSTGAPNQPALDVSTRPSTSKRRHSPSPSPPPLLKVKKKAISLPGPSRKKAVKVVHPPATDDDIDDDEPSEAGGAAKKKGKFNAAPPPPQKKPRKTRSDKGVKRGPRKAKAALAAAVPSWTLDERSDSDSPRARVSTSPETGKKGSAARVQAQKERMRELAEQAERDDNEIDWSDVDAAAPAPMKDKRFEPVVVGLELRGKEKPVATLSRSEVPHGLKAAVVGAAAEKRPASSSAKHEKARAPFSAASTNRDGVPVWQLDSDVSIDSDASSVCSLPSQDPERPFMELDAAERSQVLESFDKQQRFNARLAAKKRAREERQIREAKEREASEKRALQRIAEHAKRAQDEAAARPAAVKKPTGWGENMFTSSPQPDLEARARLTDMFNAFAGPSASPGAPDPAAAGGESDRAWSCLACTMMNHALMPACEIGLYESEL